MDIESSFTYHPVSKDQMQRNVEIMSSAKMLALLIEAHCPPSSERTLALRKLQECVMWANSSIAING